MRYKNLLVLFPVLLSLFYVGMLGIAILKQVDFDYGTVVVAALLACSLGVIFKRAWAVKGIVWAGAAGALTGVVELFGAGQFNFSLLLLVFTILSLLVTVFFSAPVARQYYSNPKALFFIYTILLIDDDRGLLKLLRTNLRKEGYFVLTAETGEKGLSLARRYRPDLILLDVILPGVKGRAVCSQLKADPRTKESPIIFLTAKDSPDDVQAEMAAGAVAHMTKPIDYRSLSVEIKKYLKVRENIGQ